MRQNEQTLLVRTAGAACNNELHDLSSQGDSNCLNVWVLSFVLPETRWINARF